MALAYFVLGLIFSATISIAYENDEDAYKFMKEVCDATQDGKHQDDPCVKQLEKLILENNHVPWMTFEKIANLCTNRLYSDGTKFQRICAYVRQGGDGGYKDWIYMEKVSCVLGYGATVGMIDPEVTRSFRHAFQECRKLSERNA